jgi:integrase
MYNLQFMGVFLKEFYDILVEINLNAIEPARHERQEWKSSLPPLYQSISWMSWMSIFRAGTGGYVFEGRDQGHISTRQIQRLLDEVAENAGLQETRMGKVRQRKRITPHLLRHSFSRWSLDAGIDISYLQQQLGHSSLSTTAIYLQARPNHRRKAYETAGFDKLLNPC